jgi:hypothetical protein
VSPAPRLAPIAETLELPAGLQVDEAEYRRLLGYPPNHPPGARSLELGESTRQWYAGHGRPWYYLREAALALAGDSLALDGVAFESRQLREHFRAASAERAVVAVVGAGRAAEDRARELWQEGKPDEYFFLESYASAVVERLVAEMSSRICGLAERGGLVAVPHYSPGYAGWDVADQDSLFNLIRNGARANWPEPIEVLPGGMLRPKKSLLAVVGLTRRTAQALARKQLVPCQACSFSPCSFRRAPYRHRNVPGPGAGMAPLRYTLGGKTLEKWAKERLRLENECDGSIRATFRFDGTTCTNLGQPLAFDYAVTLGAREEGHILLESRCRPASGDSGHARMCAFLENGPGLMQAIEEEKPLLGRPLAEILAWAPPSAPSGCYCNAETRAHKWGLVLEVLHYALARPHS